MATSQDSLFFFGETFGDLAVRESATVQQTHQSRQQTTEHVTTREVVTTTTEVTQGYYDEDGSDCNKNVPYAAKVVEEWYDSHNTPALLVRFDNGEQAHITDEDEWRWA